MKRVAGRTGWRVLLGIFVTLALTGGPVALVGAEEPPATEDKQEASEEQSSTEGSSEDADSQDATASDDSTSTEEGSTEETSAEASTDEASSADASEGSAESGNGGGVAASRQARSSQVDTQQNGEGNPPRVECGSEFFVKYGIGGSGEIGDPEFNNPPFEEPVVTLTVVDADERIYAYQNTQTGAYTIFRIVLKAGQTSENIENPPQSGTVNAPENISHITFCLREAEQPPEDRFSLDVTKVWEDEEGNPVDRPEIPEGFQIIIEGTGDNEGSLTCEFSNGDLECTGDLVVEDGEQVSVSEVNPPEGFVVEETATAECTTTENETGGTDTACTITVVNVQQAPPPPADITVQVVKDNDADENGTFTDSEEASEEGQDVTFQVMITNTSEVAVEILDLTDAFGGFEFGSPELVCRTAGGDDVIGMVLEPGQSVTCTFTIMNYAPPADETLVDTVEVTVGEEGNEENEASDSDTSVVTTVEVGGGIVTPPPPGVVPPTQPPAQVGGAGALAVTGAELALMVFLAAGLLLGGAVLIYSTRRREQGA